MFCNLRKVFLFTVGLISVTFEQFSKAILEASQSLEEQIPNISDRLQSQHKNS
jgi:hypothetical protein